MAKFINYENKDEWLALRAEDITSTESAALFGLSPYITEFELYHNKIGGKQSAFVETDRMRWGSRLESAIAYGVAEDYGLSVEPFKNYVRHSDCAHMGSSFDFLITGIKANFNGSNDFREAFHRYGMGVLEIKNVAHHVYTNSWQEQEAPDHIEVQVQHQLEVTHMEWAIICPLIGGNDAKPFIRLRDPEVGAGICRAITAFWDNVSAGVEPSPDFTRDADFIISLHQSAGGQLLDATGDENINSLLTEYELQCRIESEAATRKKSIQAEILESIGDAEKLVCGAYKLHCGMTVETPPTTITPEMVGSTYGGRKGFRNFRLINGDKK